MEINKINFNFDWSEHSYGRHILDVNILYVKGFVDEHKNTGKWSINLGCKSIFSGIVEGKSVVDIEDKIEEAVTAKIEEIVALLDREPDVVTKIINALTSLEENVTTNTNKLTELKDSVDGAITTVLDHDLRIATLEELHKGELPPKPGVEEVSK